MSTGRFAKLTYTPSVLAVQRQMGSNAANRLRFSPDEPESRPKRLVTLRVEGFDWNCPQGITPRWTSDEILEGPVGDRLRELQADNHRLRTELAARSVG